MVVLVAVALFVTTAVGTRLLEGQLVAQVDKTLEQSRRTVAGSGGQFNDEPPPPGGPRREPPSAVKVVLLDPEGQVLHSLGGELGRETSDPDVAGITRSEAEARRSEPFTVGSVHGDGQWRVILRADPGTRVTQVLAVGLGDTSDVVGQFQRAQLLLGLIVILVLAGFGAFLVRRQPQAAHRHREHGGGDRRGRPVAPGPRGRPPHRGRAPRRAINGMLGQIEASVQAREASEREARASEQRMRQFLDDASHELRTPLTSIRGFSELHRKQVDVSLDERERLVGRIESEAHRMGGLLEDMLLLARLDQDRPMAYDPVDLVPLAADAVFDLHTLDPDRPVELDLPRDRRHRASPDDAVGVVVLGDEARLRQVVANLVRNARVHTPPDTPVHLRVGVDQSGRVGRARGGRRRSRDARADAARVFERFYRADPARARDRRHRPRPADRRVDRPRPRRPRGARHGARRGHPVHDLPPAGLTGAARGAGRSPRRRGVGHDDALGLTGVDDLLAERHQRQAGHLERRYPNGMPMIVMHSSTPAITWPRASQMPPSTSQMMLAITLTPPLEPGRCTTTCPNGQRA